MSRAAAVFRKRFGRASLLRGLAKADEGRRPDSREALDE
jgi:hypothetical protein